VRDEFVLNEEPLVRDLGASDPPSDSLDQEFAKLAPEYLHSFCYMFVDQHPRAPPAHQAHDHKTKLVFKGPIYPLSCVERRELRDQINKLLNAGSIRLSESPAAAPVFFVPKSDESRRMVVDHPRLNASTKTKTTKTLAYPLPSIAEILVVIPPNSIYSKSDLKDAFHHQIRIAENNEWKTAFRCSRGLFELLVMTFRLKNAPASFQAFMNAILTGFIGISAFVHLDDILVFSPNEEQHKLDSDSNSRCFGRSSHSAKPPKVYISYAGGSLSWLRPW
jgi:hypothetical protein